MFLLTAGYTFVIPEKFFIPFCCASLLVTGKLTILCVNKLGVSSIFSLLLKMKLLEITGIWRYIKSRNKLWMGIPLTIFFLSVYNIFCAVTYWNVYLGPHITHVTSVPNGFRPAPNKHHYAIPSSFFTTDPWQQPCRLVGSVECVAGLDQWLFREQLSPLLT